MYSPRLNKDNKTTLYKTAHTTVGCIAWRLYSSRVRSGMLHGSETWPVRKENEVALQRAEMRMVRWMCNVKVKDRVPSKQLKD